MHPSASTGRRLVGLRLEARLKFDPSLSFRKDHASMFEVHVITMIMCVAIIETRATLAVFEDKIEVSRAEFPVSVAYYAAHTSARDSSISGRGLQMQSRKPYTLNLCLKYKQCHARKSSKEQTPPGKAECLRFLSGTCVNVLQCMTAIISTEEGVIM